LSVAALRDRDVLPVGASIASNRERRFSFTGEDELAADLADEARGSLHGVRRVGSHDFAVQVKLAGTTAAAGT
jgi:hypothetical protein